MNYRTNVLLIVASAGALGIMLAPAMGSESAAGLSARAEVVAAGIGDSEFDESSTPAVANMIFSNVEVSGEAHATANYGLLKASSQLTKGTADTPFNLGTGEAIFSDVLTITGGTGPGTLTMQFHNSGELTLPGTNSSAIARTELNIFFTDGSFQGDNRFYAVEPGDASATVDDTFTTTEFDFTFGQPFSFDVRLTAEVTLEATDSGTVSNDFFTSTLQLLTVSGATGPVSVTSESGTTYPIPEPASLWMLITAIAIMALPRCRVQ